MIDIQYTWGNWLTTLFGLAALYLLLRFLNKRLSRINFFGKYQNRVQRIIHTVLLVYEPLALLILGIGFVLINPTYNGLGLGLVLLVGFNHFRNYTNGRLVLFDKNIKKGNKIATGNLSGIISEMGRLGVRLKNEKGLHFVNYSKLLSEGYLLRSGEEIGGYHKLKIAPKEKETLSRDKIMDLLSAAPYLDWHYRPELSFPKKIEGHINARVSVKEKSHLLDLLALIEEWGYEAEVIEK